MRPYPDFSIEQQYWRENVCVIGVDEVGRGCLAGPVHVGAVCFGIPPDMQPQEVLSLGIHDSKACSAKKRERLVPYIISYSCAWAVASRDNTIIDQNGIVPAVEEAAVEAVNTVLASMSSRQVMIITDTLPIKAFNTRPWRHTPIPAGDRKSVTIAAASIIAKVIRDAEMSKHHTLYPRYGWKSNKGYGTAAHRAAVQKFGITPLHRKSFLQRLASTKPRTPA